MYEYKEYQWMRRCPMYFVFIIYYVCVCVCRIITNIYIRKRKNIRHLIIIKLYDNMCIAQRFSTISTIYLLKLLLDT